MNILSVSQSGVDVRQASGSQLIFSSEYPFGKLDKTNSVSFQNITILFNTEPPNPNGTSTFTTTTLVYQFAHGYKYIPSTWFLMQLTPTGVGAQLSYQQEGGLIVEIDLLSTAYLRMTADATNVYFYVDKYFTDDGGNSAPNIQGFFLKIRTYVFAGDLTGTVQGS